MKWYFEFLGSDVYWQTWAGISIVSVVACIVAAGMALIEAHTYNMEDDDARMFARFSVGALVLGPILGLAWGVIIPVAGVVAILWGGFAIIKIAGLGELFRKTKV